MKIVSLELAKQLKEAGYPQNYSEFYWLTRFQEKESILQNKSAIAMGIYYDQSISAPTADEILEQLPFRLDHSREHYLIIGKQYMGHYAIGYCYKKRSSHMNIMINQKGNIIFVDPELPNVLAKMWLHLKENNLL